MPSQFIVIWPKLFELKPKANDNGFGRTSISLLCCTSVRKAKNIFCFLIYPWVFCPYNRFLQMYSSKSCISLKNKSLDLLKWDTKYFHKHASSSYGVHIKMRSITKATRWGDWTLPAGIRSTHSGCTLAVLSPVLHWCFWIPSVNISTTVASLITCQEQY